MRSFNAHREKHMTGFVEEDADLQPQGGFGFITWEGRDVPFSSKTEEYRQGQKVCFHVGRDSRDPKKARAFDVCLAK